jgi:hypothetical protein
MLYLDIFIDPYYFSRSSCICNIVALWRVEGMRDSKIDKNHVLSLGCIVIGETLRPRTLRHMLETSFLIIALNANGYSLGIDC